MLWTHWLEKLQILELSDCTDQTKNQLIKSVLTNKNVISSTNTFKKNTFSFLRSGILEHQEQFWEYGGHYSLVYYANCVTYPSECSVRRTEIIMTELWYYPGNPSVVFCFLWLTETGIGDTDRNAWTERPAPTPAHTPSSLCVFMRTEGHECASLRLTHIPHASA